MLSMLRSKVPGTCICAVSAEQYGVLSLNNGPRTWKKVGRQRKGIGVFSRSLELNLCKVFLNKKGSLAVTLMASGAMP